MGNRPTELQVFTAQDSGKKLLCKKVPYGLVDDLRRDLASKLPEPQPPVQEVNYGDEQNPVVRQEANPADPDYLRRHEAWKRAFNDAMGEKTNQLLLKRGVLPYLKLDEEALAEVSELREFMRAEYGVELDEDDRLVFINRIALVTFEDQQDLALFLLRRNQPTEVGVKDALNRF